MPFSGKTNSEAPGSLSCEELSQLLASKVRKLPLPTRIAFIGNYLPRECGIATFTTDLCTALGAEYGNERLFAIPVNDPDSSYEYPEQVRLELEQEDAASYERAADFLNFNGNDLVCLQHEYGIYGGAAGSHVLQLLRKLKMPLVTTLHTVLREPDADQRMVLEEIAQLSDRIVVMSELAAQMLRADVRGSNRQNRCYPTRRARSALHGPQLFQRPLRHGRQIRTAHIRAAVAKQRRLRM